MYLAAMCDDETEELNKIDGLLKLYGENHPEYGLATERFENAEQLLERVRGKERMPDLFLLDIYLEGESGIRLAEELHSVEKRAKIIFVTTSREHALDAYQVEAVQYLVKPVTESKLFPVLDRIFDLMEKEQQNYFLFRANGQINRVELSDIVYCEAQRKSQCLHLTDGTQLLLHMTMTAVSERLLEFPEFARAGIAYIINLQHLGSLNAHEMHFDNGWTLHLPRGAYRHLREEYFKYYCEEE